MTEKPIWSFREMFHLLQRIFLQRCFVLEHLIPTMFREIKQSRQPQGFTRKPIWNENFSAVASRISAWRKFEDRFKLWAPVDLNESPEQEAKSH